ncbi:hypothetical protein [uncultured Desulfovibrio sp.]|uniref:phosphoribosyltransferase-like protein n=1 Tax=uncultured Desulfovibrio sp. TaxID=167968 RepID=UPI00260576D2|nr:hypothetical protein [uncultured Desulfovibrio sp.]
MLESETKAALRLAEEWIEQFDRLDRPLANMLLNDLRLVSTSQFEEGISAQIESLLLRYKKIALFPVLELTQENYSAIQESSPKKNSKSFKSMRRHAGSSNQIAYLISRLEERNPRHILARPQYKCLIAERIKAVVFIDDFIGSGKRISDFWKHIVSRTLKSWLSYNKCDVFFVSYAAMNDGVSNIIKNCRGIKKDEFLVTIENPSFKDKRQIIALCDRYTSQQNSKIIYGFGNTLTNIVFEWKCPNNTPPLLWMDHGWRPLFENRNVNASLFKYLASQENVKLAEQIWAAGQYSVALSLLNNLGQLSQDDINFVSFLSFFAKRISLAKIQLKLQVSSSEFDKIVKKAKCCSAIESNKITEFGLALLESFRRFSAGKQCAFVLKEDQLLYLPHQYKGILSRLA